MGQPFRANGATVALSATTTSSNAAILADATSVRVVNLGTVATHLAFGSAGALAATTADLVLGPNESVTLFKGAASRVAARTATGTATVYVTPGEGSL
jgi:hypothetical protein